MMSVCVLKHMHCSTSIVSGEVGVAGFGVISPEVRVPCVRAEEGTEEGEDLVIEGAETESDLPDAESDDPVVVEESLNLLYKRSD